MDEKVDVMDRLHRELGEQTIRHDILTVTVQSTAEYKELIRTQNKVAEIKRLILEEMKKKIPEQKEQK